MPDGKYPNPECKFGVAVKQDLSHILGKIDQLLEKQEEHTDTLQDGLTTKVESLHDKVDEIEEEHENEEEREKKEDQREKDRRATFKREMIVMVLGNFLSLGAGIIVALLSLS